MTTKEEFIALIIEDIFTYLNSENSSNYIKKRLDIQSKVLAFAFSLSAEIERNLISQRTKEALARIKSRGRKLGREFGSKNKIHIIDGHEEEILDLYNKGLTKNHIAKIMGCSTRTIYNFLISRVR